MSMEGFNFMEGFIEGIRMYLWRDLYKEFTCIFGGIHIGSSYISMEGLISREEFI